MPNQLEQLRNLSAVVADTGDIEAIARFRPMDATTNPSLLLKAASLPAYAHFIDAAVAQAEGAGDARGAGASARLAVAIGGEVVRLIPGRVPSAAGARLGLPRVARARLWPRAHGGRPPAPPQDGPGGRPLPRTGECEHLDDHDAVVRGASCRGAVPLLAFGGWDGRVLSPELMGDV